MPPCRHPRHRRLSFWQPAMPPATTFSRHHDNSRPSADVLRVEIFAKANLPLAQIPPPRWYVKSATSNSRPACIVHWFATLVQVMAWCREAITWANVDSVLCRLMASLGHNDLNVNKGSIPEMVSLNAFFNTCFWSECNSEYSSKFSRIICSVGNQLYPLETGPVVIKISFQFAC